MQQVLSENRRQWLQTSAVVAAVAVGLPIPAVLAQESGLFATVRRGKLKPGSADELAKRAKAGAVPILKRIAGFRAYYVVYGASDTVTTITLYSNAASAEEANKQMLPWIRENLAPLLEGPPEAVEGNVVVAALA